MKVYLPLIMNCLWPLTLVSGYMMSNVKQLLQDQLDGYDKDIRPVINQSEPLIITMDIELAAIVEFDEVNQKLTLTAVLKLHWYDESIRWDPESYGDLEIFSVNSRHFWTPSVLLTNSFLNLHKIGDSNLDLSIRSDGQIHMHPAEVFSVTCDADVTYFPWDKHKCILRFIHWGSPLATSAVLFRSVANKVTTSYYHENRSWKLDDSHVQLTYFGGVYEVILCLRRKSLFVIVNVIIPIILLSLLNILTFLAATECGERLSFSVTILLAISVFLTIVGEDLPKISNPMAIFSYYLIGVLMFSWCIILATLVSLHLYHKDEKNKIGSFWITFLGRFSQAPTPSSVTSVDFAEQSDDNKKDNSVKSTLRSKKNIIDLPVEMFTDEITSPNITWKEISALFDKVCFVGFSIALITSTTVFFTVLYTAAN